MTLPCSRSDREYQRFRDAGVGKTCVAVCGDDGGPVEVTIVGAGASGTAINTYGTAASVASSATVTVVSFTVPVGKVFLLERVEFAGENIANYEVQVDGSPIAKKRTWFGGDISGEFMFDSPSGAPPRYTAGQVIRLRIENFRPSTADFEARIQGVELDA